MGKKVLVVGGGGREHAIVWKLSESSKVDEIICAPGNGGISALAECVDIEATDIPAMIDLAKKRHVDMVVVAPDNPLAEGMVDELLSAGVRAFGPSKAAAEIESSKSFSKNLMKKYRIPTADYEVFEDSKSAVKYIRNHPLPAVIKADGLALGKGVIIAETYEEAEEAIIEMIDEGRFGDSGRKVVAEEYISGPEISILAFTDGKTLVPMISSQDHKRAFDNDEGPNTGGMGTFAPGAIYDDKMAAYCNENIFIPTIKAMSAEGRPFKGVLYFGLMITDDGPKVLEYNARFGDPETQVVLPLLKSDLYEIFDAVIDERLDEVEIEWERGAAVCVIAASGGYPGSYEKGKKITGLENLAGLEDIMVFHAGTEVSKDGEYFTSGGRVLGVTARGSSPGDAMVKSYEAIEKIDFTGMFYRKDIGVKRETL